MIRSQNNTVLLVAVMISLFLVSSAFAESAGHGGQHFTKPLVTIYPNVATEIEAKYLFLDEPQADAHEFELELGYALAKDLGLEMKVPFLYHDPKGISAGHDEHAEADQHADEYAEVAHHSLLSGKAAAVHGTSSESGFGNIVLGLKMQNDFAAKDGFLVGYGVGLELPTGDSGKGIGSDSLFTLQPFYSLGYQQQSFQIITSGRFGIPLGSEEDEDDDSTLDFGTAFVYLVSDEFKPFVEFDGVVRLNGDDSGDVVVNLSPGLRFEVAHGVALGAGVSYPLTDKEVYDFRAIASILAEFN